MANRHYSCWYVASTLCDPCFMFIMQSFMVIFGLLQSLRQILLSDTAEKVFTRVLCTGPKLFITWGAASFVAQVCGLFEVHVFNGERCLKEFLIEPVESSPEQNQMWYYTQPSCIILFCLKIHISRSDFKQRLQATWILRSPFFSI